MIDLLVVGGGPAGLATAMYGVRAGLETVIVERRPGTLDKACGEGMMPHTLGHLERLGITVEGRPLRGISYVAGSKRVDAAFRAGAGRGVRRTALHAAMSDAARTAGVKFILGDVDGVTQDAEGVRAGGLRARYLVAADGLHSPHPEGARPHSPVAGAAPLGYPEARPDQPVDRLGRGALGTGCRSVRDTGG